MAERRRGAVLEKALLDAAWEELADNGYARFTMDAVVKRAGTSPTVLYRRWSDRDALVRATIAHILRKHILEVPDTEACGRTSSPSCGRSARPASSSSPS